MMRTLTHHPMTIAAALLASPLLICIWFLACALAVG